MSSSRTPVHDHVIDRSDPGHDLLEILEQVPAPRARRGVRHRLSVVSAVGITAVIAGARSFTAIAEWAADTHADVLPGLGVTDGRVPGESTIRRLFARVDVDAQHCV